MRSSQEIGLSLVYLVCFRWFASSCALGKTIASDSLQMQSPRILTCRIDEVDGVNAGYGRFMGRKFASGGAPSGGGQRGGGSTATPRSGGAPAVGGQRGGGSTATPWSGGGRVPGGAGVIPVTTGAGARAGANNMGHQNSHQNGGTCYARNCVGSPTLILTLLASHVVHWYI